jgi:hypothetical protein
LAKEIEHGDQGEEAADHHHDLKCQVNDQDRRPFIFGNARNDALDGAHIDTSAVTDTDFGDYMSHELYSFLFPPDRRWTGVLRFEIGLKKGSERIQRVTQSVCSR